MFYHHLGKIPPKRHTQFRQPDGTLYCEELVSSEGFSGVYSNLYHTHAPTRIKSIGDPVPFGPQIVKEYSSPTVEDQRKYWLIARRRGLA